VVAILLAGLREMRANRPRGIDDIEDLLQLQVSSRLAPVSGKGRRGRSLPVGPAYDRLALQLGHVHAANSDGYRSCAILAIASSVPSEGRTTLAAGLVAAFRRQGLHAVGVQLHHSSTRADLGERLRPIFGTAISSQEQTLMGNGDLRLTSFFPSNEPFEPLGHRHRQHPAETVSSRFDPLGLRLALEEIRSEFDWIVIDVPPMSDSALADTLAVVAEMTLLVVRPAVVSRRDLVRYAEQWATWPHRPLAAVITEG
jgi:Mrp family chromosome partitioning ATPase